MDQLDKLKDDVLDNEKVDEVKDQFQPFIDKYGDFFMRLLRLIIYFISL